MPQLSHHVHARFYLYAESLGWVAQPNVNTRGTWSILQSSLITIFFCTATSIHLNIPKQRYGDWRRRWTRLCWMTVNTLAPEIFMCIAMTQYLEARMVQQRVSYFCREHGQSDPEWTLMQAFYFNMRAFVYKAPQRLHYGRTHKEHDPKAIKMKHLEAIIELGLLRDVTTDEATIKEYSKQNRLAKTVALVQASWLLLQTFARIALRLPASPLEITAVAYVSVTFFSWLLWLNKPQDVGLSITITDRRWEEVFRTTRRREDREGNRRSNSQVNLFLRPIKNQLPNIQRRYGHVHALIIGLTWFFTSGLFGGLHLLAWSYAFPSSAELWLWRTSAIAIVVLPPTFYIWVLFLDHVLDEPGVDILGRGMVIMYIAARMYNVIEVFFSLRATPPGLYEIVQWTNFLPHW